jgi:hypothetical protein
MRENQTPYAAFQIGLGIVCVLTGVSGFILSDRYTLAFESLFLGLGILLYGLANNNTDKSERGKTLTTIGAIFYVLGAILIFYNLFFNSK